MTSPSITLDGVSHVLPDGRTLFSDLHARFDQRHTGLIGRNGVGKSVLGSILAGHVTPTTGHCRRIGRVHLLAQHHPDHTNATVATIAGVQAILDALKRIEAGSTAQADFDAVGDRWDIQQQLHAALDADGLGHLHAATPAQVLSGGMAVRVALAGALASQADTLILDEPSNHLDQHARQHLITALNAWPRGLIVISHDRQLLDAMARIVELTPGGLHSDGGNYTFHAAAKVVRQEAAQQALDAQRATRRRGERALQEQRERQQRREARGHRHGQQANQAPILLGRQKQRSESTAGKLQHRHAQTREALDQQVRAAAQRVDDIAPISVRAPINAGPPPRCVVELHAVQLPFLQGPARDIDLLVNGRQRIGVTGANGSGKSTLLRVIAGSLAPSAGSMRVSDACAYLDQHLAVLSPYRSVLEQISAARPDLQEATARTQLAQMGLDAATISVPTAHLSGGEKVKAALACVLLHDPPPHLLVLDEPGNHLDLAAQQAVESMLRAYQGALLVVSHDEAFLGQLALTDRLVVDAQGWRMEAWSPG